MDTKPKVVFVHYRMSEFGDYTKRGKPDKDWMFERTRIGNPNPRGGKTVCKIDFGGGRYAVGEAVCSMSDNFCYRTGRTLAMARAIELLNTSTKIRLAPIIAEMMSEKTKESIVGGDDETD